jgi:secondary thiamine-phosphate synthase enzyme
VTIATSRIAVRLAADGGMADISDRVQGELKRAGLQEGIVTIFVPGSTGAVTTIEFEPGLERDLPQAMERIAPADIPYEHHRRWGDDNGRSHVRAAIMGPSLVVPFSQGRLVLGTWQQIVIVNWDTKPRTREIVVQIVGE